MAEGSSEKGITSRTLTWIRDKLNPRIPEEKIDDVVVAQRVREWRGNPSRKGDEQNPFTIEEILDLLGYTPTLAEEDIYERFKGPYERVRNGLQKLVHAGILEMTAADEPDLHGERLWYFVKDREVLEKFITEKESLPR